MSINVSVVIPTYRRMGLLYRCLAALSRQDFDPKRLEVIVVTDGPDDTTDWLMDGSVKGGATFRQISLPSKKGPAAARNMGWRLALGELILFTDDDTLPQRDWVRSYWEAYMRSPLDTAFRGKVVVPCPPEPTDYEKNVAGLETAEFVTANCACPKTLLQKIDGFDESFTMAWREDSDFQFRLLEQDVQIIDVPEAVVVHPVRKTYWGVSLQEQKKSLFNALLYKKHPSLFRKKIHDRPFWNYYAMILLLALAVCGSILGRMPLGVIAFAAWLLMTLDFTRRRLNGTSHSFGHVMEMFVTSMAIPFLSVYWTIYGAFRYKIFFL